MKTYTFLPFITTLFILSSASFTLARDLQGVAKSAPKGDKGGPIPVSEPAMITVAPSDWSSNPPSESPSDVPSEMPSDVPSSAPVCLKGGKSVSKSGTQIGGKMGSKRALKTVAKGGLPQCKENVGTDNGSVETFNSLNSGSSTASTIAVTAGALAVFALI